MRLPLTLFYDNKHLLGLAIVVSLVGGIACLIALPRLEDPRITTRNAIVVTPYPGTTAERVEALVTEPIEEALQEIAEVKELSSTSRAGVSSISIELQDAVTRANNDEIFSRIRDKIAEVTPALPAAALAPQFDDERGAVAFTLTVALTWRAEGPPVMGLLARHAEALSDRLRNVPGTELVRVYGKPDEELRVTLDRARAAQLGLSAGDVAVRIEAADAKRPAGLLRGRSDAVAIEIEGALDGLQRVRDVPLLEGDSGSVTRVGDIASVSRAWREPPAEIALADGRRAVFVAARVEAGERVDRWAQAARAVVAGYAGTVGAGVGVETIFDQSRYTEARLGMLTQNLLLGAGLVMVVVFPLMGWRAAAAVGTALPLVAALSLIGVFASGGALHQMSIFGMIISLGLLIDNAIVVTDEVRKRRLRGDAPREALAATLRHLFVPLLASTLTTVIGFMPIVLLPGNAGDFVGWIGGSVVLALVFSFIVAMTVVAALAAQLVSAKADGGWVARGVESRRWTAALRGALRLGLRRPALAMLVAISPSLLGFGLATQLGSEFFPPVDRNMFDVKVWLPRTASIGRTREAMTRVEQVARKHPEVRQVHWLAGNSFPSVYYNLVMSRDDQPFFAQGVIQTETAAQVDRLVPVLQRALDARFPELQIVLGKFAQGPPANAEIEYKLFGPDIAQLQSLGERVRRELAHHESVLHTRMSMPRGEPKLWLVADEDESRIAGLSLAALAGQLQGNLEGVTGGTVIEDLEQMPVRVRYADTERAAVDAIASAQFARGPGQGYVPLSALGDFALRPELGAITRSDAMRTNIISGYPRAGALPIDITFDVLERLDAAGFTLPPGYRLEVAGDLENSNEANANLARYAPILVTLMVATLILVFRSLRIFLILAAVGGLSAGLGLAATWLIDFPVSFNTILGTIGLVGVAFNNSIVVLAAIRANPAARAGDVEAMADEVLGTGRHLLSTTLTTIGGFLPLLLLTGGNFWPSLAIVLAGGVAGAMILAMAFTPAAYRLLHRREARAAA